MYLACGPWSAVRRVCRPGPSASTRAASTRTTSRWSGTTSTAPRPPSTAARAACASSIGQSRSGPVAGTASRDAVGAPPAVTWPRNAEPAAYGSQASGIRSGSSRRSGGSSDRAFSAAACRGGTARRRTSPSEPAYRSATTRAAASTAGVSTGSGETTRRIGLSRPRCSASARRSSTNPERSWPAKRTLTRTPGSAASAIDVGTVYSKARSRWARPVSTWTRATGSTSVVGSPVAVMSPKLAEPTDPGGGGGPCLWRSGSGLSRSRRAGGPRPGRCAPT